MIKIITDRITVKDHGYKCINIEYDIKARVTTYRRMYYNGFLDFPNNGSSRTPQG